MIHGLTGKCGDVCVAVEAAPQAALLPPILPSNDVDLKRMADWAMNYLIRTPRPALNYEPVFQCHPLKCPPVPVGHDVVVPCDTDARMNWEWNSVIDQWPESKLGPAGVYVNLSLGRDSKWGSVVSFFPDEGRITVKAEVKDRFFLRPPHWAPRDQVRAFADGKNVPVQWSGAYVRFDGVNPGDEVTITYPLLRFTQEVEGLWKKAPGLKMRFVWLGNMVASSDPAATGTPLFTGQPRRLPNPPDAYER